MITSQVLYIYLVVSLFYGLYASYRITPEQLRIKADNYNKMADDLEYMERTLPIRVEFLKIFAAFFWPLLFLSSMVSFIRKVLFGEERITDEELG